jgi:hypothetical protein
VDELDLNQDQGSELAPDAGNITTEPMDAGRAEPQPQWQGVLEYAKSQGHDLGHDNDVAALQSLIASYQQMQSRDYHAELGQRLAPYSGEIQRFLQAPAQDQTAWTPPEIRKEWLRMVGIDRATGLVRAREGYDPQLASKVQAYVDWREKFLDPPDQVVGPLVDQRVRSLLNEQRAEGAVHERANELVSANADWIFGPPGPDGARPLTDVGGIYAATAKSLWDSGLHEVNMVHSLARTAAENAAMRSQLSENTTAPAASASASGGFAQPPYQRPAPRVGSSLREMISHRLGIGAEDD